MTKGRRPKPSHLRLVEGTHRDDRHGSRSSVKAGIQRDLRSFGVLVRPTFLRKHGREAWDRYIAPATWLDGSREPAAIMFCELWQEMRSAPSRFPASRHSQLRGLMADLGLTDERKRPAPILEETDEFFGD